jgi:hypothetical protein
MRKSLIAAFIVFFGTAFVAMPVASANPLVDIWETITGNDGDEMEEEPALGGDPENENGENSGEEQEPVAPQPEPEEEDSTEGEPVGPPELPESPAQEGSQAKSGNSGNHSKSVSSGNASGHAASVNNAASGNGGKLPKTATPYPMMLLVGGLVMAAGLALLRVRPSRS